MTKPAGSRILQTRLEMIGYSVVTASDGEEALSAFRLLTEKIGDCRLQIADSFWYKPSTKVGGINLKSSISNPQAASKSGCSQSQIYKTLLRR
jgi:CheY-like chemotaxis protein